MGRNKILLLSITLNHFIRILILPKYKDYEDNIVFIYKYVLTKKNLF